MSANTSHGSSTSSSPAPASAAGRPGITSPAGFRAAGLHCGVKADAARNDLTLIVCDRDASAAGVFTQNRTCAAPVLVSREVLRSTGGRARAIVANSGNANAATGEPGMRDARRMAELAVQAAGGGAALVCSTGLIGNPLPVGKIEAGIRTAAGKLARGPEVDLAAARGIMTTDAGPKMSGHTGTVAGRTVTVAGIAKGAGMIAPNMATMLAFVTTDAVVAPVVLQMLLTRAVDASFNTIRVDGHTSTNDTVLVLASGLAGHAEIDAPDTPAAREFAALLDRVCLDLALMIVGDGEGADKLCEIRVEGAASDAEARAIACSLADSPLWKCALTAGHANWGRVVCATGNVMSRGGPEDLRVELGGTLVYDRGLPTGAPAEALAAAMAADPVQVRILLTHGTGRSLIRTCDINHKYITENTGKST